MKINKKVVDDLKKCNSKEDFVKAVQKNRIELNDEDLKKVNGGEWIDIVKKILNTSYVPKPNKAGSSTPDPWNEDNLGNPS